MSSLYSLLTRYLLPLFLTLSSAKGKKKEELRGFLPEVRETGRKVIWIHALSVGEIAAIKPIVGQLRNSFDNPVIYLSVATAAGYQNAKKETFHDFLSFIPYDTVSYMKRGIKTINPSLVIVTETGFWRNMLLLLKEAGIPTYLLHGRISERSMKRYLLFRNFSRDTLDLFKLLIAKSELQRKNFLAFGLAEEKVLYLGDSKIDSLSKASEAEKEGFRNLFHIGTSRTLVAGSTHEGEEDVILRIFDEVKDQIAEGLTLIIAPRRIERANEVDETCKRLHIPFTLRSKMQQPDEGTQRNRVFILDSVGELKTVYGIADLVFLGRSLFPPGGGHSALEPAIEGKFSLFGPYFSYNIEDGERIEEIGGAKQVQDTEELKREIRNFLMNPPEGYRERLEAFFERERGASKRIVARILENNVRT